MYPAQEYVRIVYEERLRKAENGRLVRSQKQDKENVVQLRRRSWIRALFTRKALAR